MYSKIHKHLLKIFICISVLCISLYSGAQHKISEQGDQPVLRVVPDSVTERMKKEKDFLYANDPSSWTEKKGERDNSFVKMIQAISRSPLLKWLIYLLVAAIIIYAIYQVMVVNDFFMFSRTHKKKKAKQEEDDELLTDNIDEKISNAIENKEYRLAIRFLYLKTLQLLHESNSIKLHAKSTNQDYIRQMQQHSGISQFRLLTHIYEYVWYGEFHPSDIQFDAIRTNFDQFIKQD